MTRWRRFMGLLLLALLRQPLLGQGGAEAAWEQHGPLRLQTDALQQEAAQSDSGFVKRRIRKHEWSLSYLHYFQEGRHSAVTGGTGTEELSVKAPSVHWRTEAPKGQAWSIDLGSDLISSPSTDRIDPVVSSASSKDLRNHVDVGFSMPWQQATRLRPAGERAKSETKQLEQQPLIGYRTGRWFVRSGASIESDYTSVSLSGGLDGLSPDGRNAWAAEAALFRDDLRWGLLNGGYRRPTLLVYPWELRGQDWHEEYLRHSLHGRFGFSRAVSPRTRLGLEAAAVAQFGLLSTPFHRVYFLDGSLRVEQLPDQRWRFPLGLTVQRFVGGRGVLDARLDAQAGSFGVQSLALRTGGHWRFHPAWQLGLHARGLVQDGSPHFAPHGQHDPQADAYTSDYDLSDFSSASGEAALIWTPAMPLGAHAQWESLALRYSHYRRNDGLTAHWFTLGMGWSSKREARRP